MYHKLAELLAKPPVYAKTEHKFWDDPHISQAMLAAHLDPTTDAASRKPETIDASVEWISGLLPRGASLLDLGCGPGLYAKRFAGRGFAVTGIDLSERSIAWAKAHDPNSTYIQQSYLDMAYQAAFDAATLIWCDYGALVPDDRANLLGKIHRALKPGGLFLLDVFTPAQYATFEESRTWSEHDSGGFWSPSPHLCLQLNTMYDGSVNLSRYVIVTDDAVRAYNIWDTAFTQETLADELAAGGFRVLSFHADVVGREWHEGSATLCAVAEKVG